MGALGAAVVRQDAFHGDAAGGKPGHDIAEYLCGGLFGFVLVGFDVGDPGMVIDHGVQVGRSGERLVVEGLLHG